MTFYETIIIEFFKRIAAAYSTAFLLCLSVWLLQPAISFAGQVSSTLTLTYPLNEGGLCGGIRISPQDALLVADPDGRIIYSKNETKRCTPASTLKVLTGLAAMHHLGKSYRFKTEFYQGLNQNLKVKGYGDPLLISEVWQEIAKAIAPRLQGFKDLVLDDTYFENDVDIPGTGLSTNPYDAPNGALCANFNTVFFKHDNTGRIISAEPQTPITPIALEKISALGLNSGRYTFSHNGHEASRYAGELLVHFLEKNGKECQGKIRAGLVVPGDTLVYTYNSIFTLEQTLKKMFEFSNNFMANQILIALGAHVLGPPGTLAKGVRVLSDYAGEELHLNIEVAEGSGISRQNRLSAQDMLAVLKRFEPHRALLVRKDRVFYKSGTLTGVKTRVGYIEDKLGNPYYFVIFLNSSNADIDSIIDYFKNSIDNGQN